MTRSCARYSAIVWYCDCLVLTLSCADLKKVLESFKIMDFSLLVGVHYLDAEESAGEHPPMSGCSTPTSLAGSSRLGTRKDANLVKESLSNLLPHKPAKIERFFVPYFFLKECVYLMHSTYGGLLACTETKQQCMLYIGIIDILQQYRMNKKMEHMLKSIVWDGVGLFFDDRVRALIR